MGPVKTELTQWLASLDRREVMDLLEKQGVVAMPRRDIQTGDWAFTFTPIPRPDSRAGESSTAGAISIFPGRTAMAGDWSRIHAALREKARRYGDLGLPFVVALLVGDAFLDNENVASALSGDPAFSSDSGGNVRLGRTGGLWSDSSAGRVSAVISAFHLNPASVATVEPLLWHAEHATHPLRTTLPWTAKAHLGPTGEIAVEERLISPRRFFGLSAEWPGPGRPFA
jgi:hypothetical protein